MRARKFHAPQPTVRASTPRILWPKITLQKLEVFCGVAREGSVSRAAELIGIAQPAVSAHLRGLESKLGMRLVARSGRNIVLTEAGEHVFRWATDIVTRSLELKHDIVTLASGNSGSAVVSASMAVGSYVLGSLMSAFHLQYPNSRITTKIFNPRLAIESVRTGDCDFAVLILDPEQPIDDLVLERLWQEQLLLVAAADSHLVGATVDMEAVGDLPFIAPPKGLVARDLEDAALSAYGIVRRRVVLEFGHPEPMKRAVRADVGVSLQLESAVQEDIAASRLRVVPIPGVELFQTVFLLLRKRKRFSPLQQRLIDFIRAAQPKGLYQLKP